MASNFPATQLEVPGLVERDGAEIASCGERP